MVSQTYTLQGWKLALALTSSTSILQDVYTKFGEGRGSRCKDNADMDTDVEATAGTSCIPLLSQGKMVWYI